MANPLMGMMGNPTGNAPAGATPAGINTGVIQSAKRMMNMLQTASNPQQAIRQAAQQNPQLNAVMQMIGGRNPAEVAREEYQKRGLNVDDIINLLRN